MAWYNLRMRHREAPVVLFTVYGCPYCQNSVKFLRQNQIPHKAINIGNNANMMLKLAESTGWKSVPKIFVQGQFIGGYNELMQMADSGELNQRLGQPMA
jgi:glutaredoxin-related protein